MTKVICANCKFGGI